MWYDFLLAISVLILLAAGLSLYRVVRGPSILDRVVGVNVIGTKTIAVIVLTGYLFERVEFFLDIAFVYALINFVGALALASYFERKGVDSRPVRRGAAP
jgi:multicomponent Na+:H+ antiporter subunit F